MFTSGPTQFGRVQSSEVAYLVRSSYWCQEFQLWRRRALKGRTLFLVFSMINFLNFLDRGIIPGASQEFNHFIVEHLGVASPDIFLGLLQSAFIAGYSVSSLLFGHLVHWHCPFNLMGVGISIWCVAALLSGLAKGSGGYMFLFFARMLSGVGEASFQSVVPPFISDTAAPHERGLWMALFFTAMPVGTAAGYAYGSLVASSPLRWSWAFFMEGLAMLPLALLCFCIPASSATADHVSDYERPPCVSVNSSENAPEWGDLVDSEVDEVLLSPGRRDCRVFDAMHMSRSLSHPELTPHPGRRSSEAQLTQGPARPTWREELAVVTSSHVFLCVMLGYAAYTAVTVGLSTFGSEFLIGLGFSSSERGASATFGALVSLAGLVGTPIGGLLIDRADVSGTMMDSHKLRLVLAQGLAMVMAATTLTLLAATATHRGPFLAFLFFGCLFLFMATSQMNLAIMLSVPRENRSFALAVNVLGIHLLGDVPSPIVVGALKDLLAPHCVFSSADSEAGDARGGLTPACLEERGGLRLTVLCVALWLVWTVVYFVVAVYNQQQSVSIFATVCGELCPGSWRKLPQKEREMQQAAGMLNDDIVEPLLPSNP